MINYGNYFEPPCEVESIEEYFFEQVCDEAYDKFKKCGIEDNKIILAMCEQRLQEEQPAWDFFDDNKMDECHAYAILGKFKEFRRDYNFPEPDLDRDDD